jgi:hypothetical protein
LEDAYTETSRKFLANLFHYSGLVRCEKFLIQQVLRTKPYRLDSIAVLWHLVNGETLNGPSVSYITLSRFCMQWPDHCLLRYGKLFRSYTRSRISWYRRLVREGVLIRGLSGKYPAIINISKTGHVTLTLLCSLKEETFLLVREWSLSRMFPVRTNQSAVGRRWPQFVQLTEHVYCIILIVIVMLFNVP